MTTPYKIEETLQYHETVIYDGDGNEVVRLRRHDDTLYDEGPREDLTPEEHEDYIGGPS